MSIAIEAEELSSSLFIHLCTKMMRPVKCNILSWSHVCMHGFFASSVTFMYHSFAVCLFFCLLVCLFVVFLCGTDGT